MASEGMRFKMETAFNAKDVWPLGVLGQPHQWCLPGAFGFEPALLDPSKWPSNGCDRRRCHQVVAMYCTPSGPEIEIISRFWTGEKAIGRGIKMKILDPMPADVRLEIKTNIQNHTEVLRELLSASAAMARKYLILVNAGAAVALMAFMENNQLVRSASAAWVSLGLFAGGVMACGILSAFDYHNQLDAFQVWLRDSNMFFRNELDLDDLYGTLNTHVQRKATWPIIAGYAALLCFMAGASLSVGAFFLHRPAELSAEQLFAEETTCGTSARDWFTKLGGDHRAAAGDVREMESHYNRQLNRCFAVLSETNPEFVSFQLVDVNQNEPIGFYVQTLRDKQPSKCEIEHRQCHSGKEWSSLIATYTKG